MKIIRPFPISNVSLVSSTVSAIDSLCITSSSTISTSSIANPSVITVSAPHNITVGAMAVVTISGHTGSTPSINGEYLATITGTSTFTIPVNVTTGGTGGTAVTPAYKSGNTYSLADVIQVDSPTFTFTSSGSTLTAAAHGFQDGEMLNVSTTGTLPNGLVVSFLYWIVESTENTLKLSTIKNGAPIITTSAGTGTHTAIISSNKVYESLISSNIGNTPHKFPTQWLDLGSTNKYKCFDGSITSQTTKSDSISYVIQTKGRVDSIALMNISGQEVVISARISGQAVGATTNSTGYAIGLSTITLASAGTGKIEIDDIIMFAGQSTQYTVTIGDSNVSNGGTISFTPPLVASIPTSATAISVNKYGLTTYSLISSIEVTSYWSWCFEPIYRKQNFIDIDFPTYNNLEVTITINNTGNTVKCGGLIVGLSKSLGGTQYGSSLGLIDYSVKTTDVFGNKVVTERAYSAKGSFLIFVDRVATDGVKQLLEQYRAIPIVYVGSDQYDSTIIFGYYKDFSVVLEQHSRSLLSIDIEGLI